MIPGDIAAEYRRLNAEDSSAFRRWMLANTIAGAASLIALIVIASIYSNNESGALTAQKQSTIVQAQAK